MTDRKNAPLISVIVLNWNRKQYVDPFIKSYLSQSYPEERMELLFTDNGSVDGSIEYLKKHYGNNPNIKLVANGKNYGYAEGNNRAIRQARGDFVLICNNDLELDKNLVHELVTAAQKHKASVTTVKLMMLKDKAIINNAGSRLAPDSDWPIYEIGMGEKDKGQYNTDTEITAFCGACVLFTRDFLQTVGLYDKRFFLYFEDGDLSWRGQKAGRKFIMAPKAIAYHVLSGSTKEGSPTFNHYVGRNRVLILAKHARLGVLLKGMAKTVRDHLFVRIKNILLSAAGKYGKKSALKEFYLSQKMLWAIVFMLPYAFLKRWKIIKEATL